MLIRMGESGQTLEHFPKRIVNTPGLQVFKRHLGNFWSGLKWPGSSTS